MKQKFEQRHCIVGKKNLILKIIYNTLYFLEDKLKTSMTKNVLYSLLSLKFLFIFEKNRKIGKTQFV